MARFPSRRDHALIAIMVTGILLQVVPGALSEISGQWPIAAPVLVGTGYPEKTGDVHMFQPKNSTGSFALINTKMSWDQAFIWCLDRKGRLADVQTRVEMEFLLKIVGPGGRYWTGATNHGSNGEFIWTSAGGTRVDKRLFARPQDSGTTGCTENCVALKSIKNQLGLTTRRCTDKFFPICKF